MTLETAIFDKLKNIVGNRVAPVIFPQPPALPTWPAIRYTIIDNVPEQDICGDGDDDTSKPRVQLDVVAETFKAARALRLQIMAAMTTFDPPALLENSASDYDAETKTFREIMDYTFHGSSPQPGNSP